ncbi:riboflavin biosynthesis pyrimidine reductase [Cryobacterium mesophilum]|uniref:Pyrimidine reductase n=1 Tax=Terrimesophilobacter mesophilus TaxID=433647 RepID=A0A4R8V9U1_9MICO|nr:dihydrofolate reductase family protein [Terrimesophilobacter mesophilus]MBB5631839.1 riboflavin biosynthesis pyrimidine reductase [Terrimesophilobacter mesophilus]TFB78752.1 pyrimidine reductase [Terrimesophilobacter mesophilus]
MTLTRLIPAPPAGFDLDDADDDTLESLYTPPQARWLRLNLVASVNGNAAGSDGTSNGLSNRTDRRILGAIRRLSDVVLVGASSVRREGYFLPKSAPLAIVTGTGDFRGHRIPADVGPGRIIVLCPASAEDMVRSSLGDRPVAIVQLPGPRLQASAIVDALRRLGHERIVCEGGPMLASQLVDADVVDELCLSTSPIVNGVDVPVLPGLDGSRPLRLNQLLVDSESVLYARWAVRSAP